MSSFTEFYVQSTGSNLNAGSTQNNSAVFTSAAGDSDGTSVFTPNDGSTPASTVSAGMWGSVYVTAGATVAVFVGRITAVAAGVNGAITFSTTAKAGTFPASSAGAHTITCKVGGAWAGPSGAVAFPFGFAAGTMLNASSNKPRVNFLAETHAMTAGITQSTNGCIHWQGYSVTVGDGGKCTIDGGVASAYYNLFTVSGVDNAFTDFIFSHNGNSGTTQDGVVVSGNETLFNRCVFHHFQKSGVRWTGVGHMIECEAYACNQGNTTSAGALLLSTAVICTRCIAHDNPGSGVDGFTTGGATLIECIAETNGRHGARSGADTTDNFLNCDFYNNGGAGISLGTGSGSMIATIHNCNFIKNGTYGVLFNNAVTLGTMHNCGFGVGTQANASGDYSAVDGIEIILTNLGSGSADGRYVTGVTPWTDPANGDFRINLAAAKGAGRGKYLQTASSYAGTRGYPDIGSNQSSVLGTEASFSNAG